MSPSAGTGAGELHVELCVPNENHRAYNVALCSFNMKATFKLKITMSWEYLSKKPSGDYLFKSFSRLKKLSLKRCFVAGFRSA
jgi:hypothetical protein